MHTASTSKLRSRPAGAHSWSGASDRGAAHLVVTLRAHDHVPPDDLGHLHPVAQVLGQPIRIGGHAAARGQPLAPPRRLDDRDDLGPARGELRGDRQQERSGTGQQDAAAREHALALGQRLRAARGHHARERPPRERDRAVVGARGEHDRAREDPGRPVVAAAALAALTALAAAALAAAPHTAAASAGKQQDARLRHAPDGAAGQQCRA